MTHNFKLVLLLRASLLVALAGFICTTSGANLNRKFVHRLQRLVTQRTPFLRFLIDSSPPYSYFNIFPTSPTLTFKSNKFKSCKNRCGQSHDPSFHCSCNSVCVNYDDCCDDYEDICLTCTNKCQSKYNPSLPCQCNRKCDQFDNCCDDYEDICDEVDFFQVRVGFDSCAGRCNVTGTDPTKDCQCNIPCMTYGDCCDDYASLCLGQNDGSCAGRCGNTLDPAKPCQCNTQCSTYGDCCPDYSTYCETTEPGVITNAELASLSQQFLTLDSNNVINLVGVNLQGENSNGGPDLAPDALLTLRSGAHAPSTIAKLLPLFDNYFPAVGTAEVITSQELAEETAFLDAIFATPIFQRLEEFLVSKNAFTGSFRTIFYQIWFGLYSRQNNILGSSGFEHIFLGELKSGVSGFHNWIYFANEEAKGTLNYKGYLETYNMDTRGQSISHTFDWLSNNKPISSMFIGSSPEFDLAIFTLCWFARPNALCPIVLNGNSISIQTYDITYNGNKFVASAYPNV